MISENCPKGEIVICKARASGMSIGKAVYYGHARRSVMNKMNLGMSALAHSILIHGGTFGKTDTLNKWVKDRDRKLLKAIMNNLSTGGYIWKQVK